MYKKRKKLSKVVNDLYLVVGKIFTLYYKPTFVNDVCISFISKVTILDISRFKMNLFSGC